MKVRYTVNAENRVLAEIIQAGRGGIHQKDLLEKIPGIHRSTINRIAPRLEKKGQIRIKRKGKTVLYIARSEARINVGIGGQILGGKFTRNYSLLDFAGRFISRQYFTQKIASASSGLEKTIFEFSNLIGGFITYIFIQAMNEDNINKLSLLQKKSLKKEKTKTRDYIIRREHESMLVTEEWINSSIASNLTGMLSRFRYSLRPFGFIPDVLTKEGSKKRHRMGPYLLDKEAIVKLSKAFASVYPNLDYDLKLLTAEIQEDIRWHKTQQEELRKEYEKQSKCKHEMSEPREWLQSEDGKWAKMIQECHKCGLRKVYDYNYGS